MTCMCVVCEQPYGNIGNVMKEQNNLEGAALFYKKALKLQPDFADALGNLAAVELMQVRQALPNTPCQAAALSLNCLYLLPVLQNKVDESRDHYRLALKLNPDVSTWRVRRRGVP